MNRKQLSIYVSLFVSTDLSFGDGCARELLPHSKPL